MARAAGWKLYSLVEKRNNLDKFRYINNEVLLFVRRVFGWMPNIRLDGAAGGGRATSILTACK